MYEAIYSFTGVPSFAAWDPVNKVLNVASADMNDLASSPYAVTGTGTVSHWTDETKLTTTSLSDSFSFNIIVRSPCLDAVLTN